MYRSGKDCCNDVIFSVDQADVDDLRNLVDTIDIKLWHSRNKQCYLNPCFGESSYYVGGADADIVLNGTLIDSKTTKYLSLKQEYLRQLIGYYVLNLREGDPYKVRSLGIYFARHGVLFSFPIPVRSGDSNKVLYKDSKGRLIPDGWDGIDSIWDDIEASLKEHNELLTADNSDSGER